MSLNKTYEVRHIVMEIGSASVKDFVPGSVLRVERNEDDFSFSNGVRILNHNRSGRIIFSLLESSSFNEILFNYKKADEKYGRGNFPVLIKDCNNTVLHKIESAWIQDTRGYPEVGIQPGERIWILDAGSIENGFC
ncbi:MAG TPA: hypothetical protein DF383_04970 [Deltaproteobacteria bacterium]|nr:hypothetical protein [Deltaproteobacteria bacterium]